MTSSYLPLATLWVKAYRQEHLVAQAVESAFAQTYPNLEIILSDDGSPDGTFRVMQEMAAAYDGPHRVRLNRNPKNLGIVGHNNLLWEIAEGELRTGCAGDDMAEPTKVARLVDAWREDPENISIVHSAALLIDADGAPLGRREPAREVIEDPSPMTLLRANGIGAATLYHRRVHDLFGPLPDGAMVEDGPLYFRGALSGRIVYVPEMLVRYRVGGISDPADAPSDPQDYVSRELYGFRPMTRAWRVTNVRSFLRDMEKRDFPGKADCREACLQVLRRDGFKADLYRASPAGSVAMLPRALLRSLRTRSLQPLKMTLHYALGPLYVRFHERRRRAPAA